MSALRKKKLCFVCGGIGLAPLKSLIDYTIAKKFDFGRIIILYGTKHPDDILFKKAIREWQEDKDIEFYMTVDRADADWKGNVGVITTLIPPLTLDIPQVRNRRRSPRTDVTLRSTAAPRTWCRASPIAATFTFGMSRRATRSGPVARRARSCCRGRKKPTLFASAFP